MLYNVGCHGYDYGPIDQCHTIITNITREYRRALETSRIRSLLLNSSLRWMVSCHGWYLAIHNTPSFSTFPKRSYKARATFLHWQCQHEIPQLIPKIPESEKSWGGHRPPPQLEVPSLKGHSQQILVTEVSARRLCACVGTRMCRWLWLGFA